MGQNSRSQNGFRVPSVNWALNGTVRRGLEFWVAIAFWVSSGEMSLHSDDLMSIKLTLK